MSTRVRPEECHTLSLLREFYPCMRMTRFRRETIEGNGEMLPILCDSDEHVEVAIAMMETPDHRVIMACEKCKEQIDLAKLRAEVI